MKTNKCTIVFSQKGKDLFAVEPHDYVNLDEIIRELFRIGISKSDNFETALKKALRSYTVDLYNPYDTLNNLVDQGLYHLIEGRGNDENAKGLIYVGHYLRNEHMVYIDLEDGSVEFDNFIDLADSFNLRNNEEALNEILKDRDSVLMQYDDHPKTLDEIKNFGQKYREVKRVVFV